MARVLLTEPAKFDLLDIEYYIFTELCNPQAARRITDGILNVINSLKINPERHSYVNDAELRRKGLRMIKYGNYNIFYYHSERDGVYIIRILYNQVDWQNVLKE